MSYTIEAVLLDRQSNDDMATSGSSSASNAEGRGVRSNGGASSRLASSAEHVREVEAKLLQHREDIRAFEIEYRQVTCRRPRRRDS